MDLSPIVARIKAQCPALRTVGVSADMQAAIDGVVATPAAFVLPLREQGQNLGMTSSTGLRLTQHFGVLLVLANKRDAAGAAALDALHAQRVALRTALLGWVVDAASGQPVGYSSGSLVNLDSEGRLWWMDEFSVVSYG